MSFKASAAIACVATILAGIAATHPLELRPSRWTRIIASLPIVLLITSVFNQLNAVSGYFALWGFGLLGFLWASPIAHAATSGVHHLIFGEQNRLSSGVHASFSGARALKRHGDLPEAIRLTEAELEKEPLSYEGLMLLSELFEQVGEQQKAIGALQHLLQSGNLTANQRKCVRDRSNELARGVALCVKV